MPTTLFLLDTGADTQLSNDNALLAGGTPAWHPKALGTARGAGVVASDSTATAAGPTAGLEIKINAGDHAEWISPPVSADVTISGAITGNIWAAESNMSANVAINFVVDVVRATSSPNTVDQIVKSARVTEVAVTTRAVNNFTATPGAGVTVNRGDRIRVRIFGDDAGTMGSGFTFNIGYAGTTAGVDGDTSIAFTENFSFESAPSGTTLYLTDTASDVSTASVDREAWTARGSGVVNDVTNTVNGWTAGVQVTDTAGGTVVDWFTKQLQAFTLTGMAQGNLRARESSGAEQASLRLEIARVDSDGTNPTVWASWCISTASSGTGELNGAAETAETAWVSGDDLAISDGQRLRLRLYADDISVSAMASGGTVTTYYNGTSGGASGDTYVILPQSVTEFVAGGIIDQELIILQAVNRSSVY